MAITGHAKFPPLRRPRVQNLSSPPPYPNPIPIQVPTEGRHYGPAVLSSLLGSAPIASPLVSSPPAFYFYYPTVPTYSPIPLPSSARAARRDFTGAGARILPPLLPFTLRPVPCSRRLKYGAARCLRSPATIYGPPAQLEGIWGPHVKSSRNRCNIGR